METLTAARAVRSICVSALVLLAVASASSTAQADLIAPDAFEVTVRADTVTVRHMRAEYNCCLAAALYEVDVDPPTIDVVEIEDTPVPCDCYCLFDLSVSVAEVPPGEYELRFSWYDYGDWVWQLVVLPVLVPDAGQSGAPVVAAVEQSDCYFAATPVPDGTMTATTWSTVKAVYR